MTTTQTKWTKETILAKIMADDRWLYKGLVAIYNRQTEDEKHDDHTKLDNQIGFNGPDARTLSKMAKQVIKYNHLYAQDKAIVRSKLAKYAGQLAKIANGKIT